MILLRYSYTRRKELMKHDRTQASPSPLDSSFDNEVIRILEQLIAEYQQGQISSDQLCNKIIISLHSYNQELAGKTLSLGNAVIRFGDGSQIGSVVVDKVAGRDNINITVNLSKESQETTSKTQFVTTITSILKKEELLQICTTSNIEQAQLANETTFNIASAIVSKLAAAGKMHQLLEYLTKNYPNTDWHGLYLSSTATKDHNRTSTTLIIALCAVAILIAVIYNSITIGILAIIVAILAIAILTDRG